MNPLLKRNNIFFLFLAILILSGCKSLSQVDNVDLNWVYAPMYARKLKTKPDDPQVYFNLVKFKISNRAHIIYIVDRKLKDEGGVYLKFRIKKDGVVEQIEVIDEKSTKNSALREIAVEAIQKSSPFPKFYKTIKQEVLNFNVAIEFSSQEKLFSASFLDKKRK